MNDPKLEGGHAAPPETERVTSGGDPDLQVAWDMPSDAHDVTQDPILTEAGPGVETSADSDADFSLTAKVAQSFRERPALSVLAAALLGLALGVIAAPRPNVLYLAPRPRGRFPTT